MSKLFLLAGTGGGFLAVLLGAFGAHALRGRLGEAWLNTFQTGVQYQMYHALALLGVGLMMRLYPEQAALKWSGVSFIVGMLLFSGSLYALALTQIRWFGPVTPIGGLAFMVGWILFAYAVLKIN